METSSNTQSNEDQNVIPYLLFVYQNMRGCRAASEALRLETKYNLTKELVKTNLDMILKTPKDVGRYQGVELRIIWQGLKSAKYRAEEAKKNKSKKTNLVL